MYNEQWIMPPEATLFIVHYTFYLGKIAFGFNNLRA